MSAFTPKADFDQRALDVRFVPKADMTDLPYAGIKRRRRALLPVASLMAAAL